MKQPFFASKRNVVFTAIFYTFLWGCAFPLVKVCMQSFSIADSDNMSKCLVAGIRFLVSGFITLGWCAGFGGEGLALEKSSAKYAVMYGFLATALQYAFTYIGLSRIDGSKGAIFDQLCVFIIVLLGGLVFKDDKLNFKKIAGCIVGFMGIAAVNTTGMSFEFSVSGEGAMLAATACQTVAYFVAKKSAGSVSAPKLVGYGQLIGGIVLCVFALAMGGRIGVVTPVAVLTLCALSVISSAAYVLSPMPLKYFTAFEIS